MLLVSPTLAQTLGLEEALLVQLLFDMQQLQGSPEVVFSSQQQQTLLPFWTTSQFGLVLKRLKALGVVQVRGERPWTIVCDASLLDSAANLRVEPQTEAAQPSRPEVQTQTVPLYAMSEPINETRQRNQFDEELAYLKTDKPVVPAGRGRKSRLTQDWEPSDSFPKLLSFHDIPLEFALSELAKFRQYYSATDRTEISWDVRFLNWVQRSWHDSLNSKGRHERQKATNGESTEPARDKRTQVRDALRNIRDTDW
ncbi:DnaT-like ssDNA-binding domain-containing protein [Reinekea sp.]|jgi:hypothetical protein|uniref:DnaT-like ssDNA-binding domain-containing protein n=1 Tax=Reinekea sp. TaxID=1970455 RepID=UPI002A8299F5|nr:DnaT-like ssDNA-binding domain-containing protein [Reinekea sp.]